MEASRFTSTNETVEKVPFPILFLPYVVVAMILDKGYAITTSFNKILSEMEEAG